MRRLPLLLLILCAAALSTQARAQDCTLPASPPPDKSRMVFLLDTSGSMQGLGVSKANIFAKVQGAILRGMRATKAPGSVELMTFDAGPRERQTFAWPSQQKVFEQKVNQLQADGANTYLYTSMQKMFGSLDLRSDMATTVYVITDGIDNNPSKAATMQTALSAFDQIRGPFDKLYFVALGEKVPGEIQGLFNATTFARAVELAINQPPDFTSSSLLPSIVDVGSDGTFPLKRPAGSKIGLESGSLGGAAVTLRNPGGAGDRVKLDIQGTVPAGTTGYLCLFRDSGIGRGGTPAEGVVVAGPGVANGLLQNNLILRFQRDTPPLKGEEAVPVDVLGTLVLLNPEVNRTLKPGQSAELKYKAVKGPVTVEVSKIPNELEAKLPDQVISLLEGETTTLRVTDRSLKQGQQAAPLLRLNNTDPYPVPKFTGVAPRPFPWAWLALPLLLLMALLFWLRRDRRPFDPYALSINRALIVSLHSENGRIKRRPLRRDLMDIGQAFREDRLRGLQLARFKPEVKAGEEVVLDNSDIQSIRNYAAQQMQRASRLDAQPEHMRLQKDKEPPGTFLQIAETLHIGLLYRFTDYTPPPQRVRPPAPPPEAAIEVIVTLIDGTQVQELELPLDDVDLADVFGNEQLRGLVVRREPGLLRLRALTLGMQLRHISRQFHPHDALPLAVMLDLSTPTGPYQISIHDKASWARMKR